MATFHKCNTVDQVLVSHDNVVKLSAPLHSIGGKVLLVCVVIQFILCSNVPIHYSNRRMCIVSEEAMDSAATTEKENQDKVKLTIQARCKPAHVV